MAVEKTLKITNKLGLHARAAAKLVQLAVRYKSDVKLARIDDAGKGNAQTTEVNAKSIMGVLMLAAAIGTTVRLRCEGPDEQEALDGLVSLFEGKFGEE